MKRYLSLILVAMCAFLSCAKIEEDRQQEEKGLGTKIFYAQTPSEETKIFIDNEYAIHWTADDRISVFCSPTNEQYRFTGKTGDDSGSFENIEEPATPTYSRNYSVYPYQEGNTSSSEGTITVTLPSTQNYVEKSFGLGANTMAAATKDLSEDTFKFKNVCGYLMIKLYGGDKIKSIRFKGNNGEKIAGEATITASPDAKPVVAMGPSSTTEIILACPEGGVATQESSENYTQFWIVVPPTTFSKGFTVEITNTDDAVVKRSTNKSVTIKRNEVIKMAPVKVDSQNSKELLSFSLSDGTNTYDAFDISNGYVNVQVPNGTDMTNMTAIFQHNGASIKVNGVVQTSGVDKHDFSDFVNPLTYVVTSKCGEIQSYIIRLFNLPVLIINTDDGKEITSKTTYKSCTIKLIDKEMHGVDCSFIDESANIKGRGNSTWSWPKKPYNIKLSQKISVLGMPEHKKWCLLANYGDRTLIRNAFCYEISRQASGLDWVTHGKHIDVLLNGKLLGNYYLCEKIEVDKNRVNVDKTNGFLFEYDSRDDGYYFTSKLLKLKVKIKSPVESVEEDPGGLILGNLKNEIDILENAISSGGNHDYLKYIDVYSFADFFLVEDFVGNNDVKGFSDYMHKDNGKVIVAGPVWDFDLYTFSINYQTQHFAAKALYYPYLIKDDIFKYKLKERWQELKQKLIKADMINFADSIYHHIEKSALRDEVLWPPSGKSGYAVVNGDTNLTIRDATDRLVQIFENRFGWMDSYINSLVVNFDTLPGANEDVNGQQDETDNFNFGF